MHHYCQAFTRREFLRTLAASCAAASLPDATLAAESKPAARPNILLITADDMNWDSVGVFGCKIPGITPHIDRLASEGIRFARAHVTIAVCQPCRSVLMTGLYPHHNGAEGFGPIKSDVPTLQERLRAAGYLNGILSKTEHLAPKEKFCWDCYVTPPELGAGRSPELYYKHSKAFFDQAKAAGKPFFLMANSNDPHRPFAGSDAEIEGLGKPRPYSRKFEPNEIEVPGFLPDLPDIRRELAQYFTSVHRCDETVGEVLRALDDAGCRENTLVMFLSDNGASFPFSKANCYTASTRTPWIVRWPGRIKAGSVDEKHFISAIDFTPTALDAAGLDQIPNVDGRSFLSICEGGSQAGREWGVTVFHETVAKRRYEMRAVHDARFCYIFNAWPDGETTFRNEAQSGLTFKAMQKAAESDPKIAERVKLFQYRVPEELYDVRLDPNALKNLADDPDRKDTLDQMRRRLLEHLTRTGDHLLAEFKKRVSVS